MKPRPSSQVLIHSTSSAYSSDDDNSLLKRNEANGADTENVHDTKHSKPRRRYKSETSSIRSNDLNCIYMQTDCPKEDTHSSLTHEMQKVPLNEDKAKQSKRPTTDSETMSSQLPEPQWNICCDESDENNISRQYNNFKNEDQATHDDQPNAVGGIDESFAFNPFAKRSDLTIFEPRPLDENSFHEASTPLLCNYEHGPLAANGFHAAPKPMIGDLTEEDYASDVATDDELASGSERAVVKSIHRLIQKVRYEFHDMNLNALKDKFIPGRGKKFALAKTDMNF